MNHQFLQICHEKHCSHPSLVGSLNTDMKDLWAESARSRNLTREPNQLSTPLLNQRIRVYHREVSELVCEDATKQRERRALKRQVLAIWEDGNVFTEMLPMNWKDNRAILKDVEGPAIHPLDRDSPETEMTECVDKW